MFLVRTLVLVNRLFLGAKVPISDNLHAFQKVETPNPPAPFPQREGGAGNH